MHRSLVVAVFPFPSLGVCGPQPATLWGGVAVNKEDGRGLSLSLNGLASLLSSVRRLCGQASKGKPWGEPGTFCPPDASLQSVPSCPEHGMLFSTSREKTSLPRKIPFWGWFCSQGS